MFIKMRRWIAGKILGDETALYLSSNVKSLMEGHLYNELSDEQLAAVSRRWFAAIRTTINETAGEKNLPVIVYTTQSAVLSLAQHLKELNAETGTFLVKGTIDGGATTEDFEVVVTRHPHDPSRWDDDAPAVEQTEDADGKITSLRYRIKNP